MRGCHSAIETDGVTVQRAHTDIRLAGVIEFHADRPFLYAITEVSTGAIFFIGQYTGQ